MPSKSTAGPVSTGHTEIGIRVVPSGPYHLMASLYTIEMNKEKGVVDYIWVVLRVGPRREIDNERDLKTRHWDVRTQAGRGLSAQVSSFLLDLPYLGFVIFRSNVHFVSYQMSK